MKQIKSFLNKFKLKSARIGFRFLGNFIPNHTGRVAVNIFITPKPYLRPFWERELIKRGKPLSLKSGRSAYCWGKGPTVLLVHGWEGRGTQLGKFIDPLVKSGFRVIAWDGPAHGQSPGTQTHIVQFSKAISDDSHEMGPLCGIIAHSFGAAASAFALANPTRGLLRCDSIVMISAPSSIGTAIDRYLQFIEMSGPSAQSFKTILEKTVGVTIEEVEIGEIVKRISIPALIIHDTEDREVPYVESEAIAKNWPNAIHQKVSGLGHRKILKDPGVIKKSIAFISSKIPS